MKWLYDYQFKRLPVLQYRGETFEHMITRTQKLLEFHPMAEVITFHAEDPRNTRKSAPISMATDFFYDTLVCPVTVSKKQARDTLIKAMRPYFPVQEIPS